MVCVQQRREKRKLEEILWKGGLRGNYLGEEEEKRESRGRECGKRQLELRAIGSMKLKPSVVETAQNI